MPTINQLVKGIRVKKKKKNRVRLLESCPQKRGVCLRVFIMKPRKPNSALRKVARVRLTTGKIVTVAIPGIGHKLSEYSTVLVRGGRAPDTPGIRYKLIRGKLDFVDRESFVRSNRRSKFGVKKS